MQFLLNPFDPPDPPPPWPRVNWGHVLGAVICTASALLVAYVFGLACWYLFAAIFGRL